MRSYEEIQADIRRRKRERWVSILSSEPAGRAPGRRPRDPEQERLLALLDRKRLARRRAAGDVTVVSGPLAADDDAES